MVGVAPGGRASMRPLLVAFAKVARPTLFTAGFRTHAFAAWEGAREVVGRTKYHSSCPLGIKRVASRAQRTDGLGARLRARMAWS